jgi:hypothetical protein
MSSNRRRGTNKVRISLVTKGVAVTVIVMVVGLSYVYMKNKLHQYGEHQRVLEQRLAGLRQETQLVEVQIAEWSSRAVLQRRLHEGFVRLVPIPDDRIVRLNGPGERPVVDGLRPVANAGGALR